MHDQYQQYLTKQIQISCCAEIFTGQNKEDNLFGQKNCKTNTNNLFTSDIEYTGNPDRRYCKR